MQTIYLCKVHLLIKVTTYSAVCMNHITPELSRADFTVNWAASRASAKLTQLAKEMLTNSELSYKRFGFIYYNIATETGRSSLSGYADDFTGALWVFYRVKT